MMENIIENKEYVSFTGNTKADIRFFDGALRHAVGSKHYQVVRACRQSPEKGDGYGWTYNHASMMCYWNNHFWVEYISGPIDEHEPISHTLLTWSKTGVEWERPIVVFPQFILPDGVYKGPLKEHVKPGDTAVMHQRTCFYVSSSDRLIVTGFYGVSPENEISPNNGYGIARVAREIYKDFSMSEIYVVRYNSIGGFDSEDVPFPSYMDCKDKEFVSACDEMLENPVFIKGWWEEQRFDKELFIQKNEGKAFCSYTLKDGRMVGIHKHALVTMSTDDGKTWSDYKKSFSVETSTGKVWAQSTSDGRYAMVYNPSPDSMHRWPLVVTSSDDGISFSDMLTLTTQVSPKRYMGWAKNLGPQYVRGICEYNPQPKDNNMWITYSMNKEDIWVCKAILPITGEEKGVVDDDFSKPCSFDKWSVHSPLWARVEHDLDKKALILTDSDPYDKAFAERIFQKSSAVNVSVDINIECLAENGLYIDITDEKGAMTSRILFGKDRYVYLKSNGVYIKMTEYMLNVPYKLDLSLNCYTNTYSAILQSDEMLFEEKCKFNQSVFSVERLVFQTKLKINSSNLESNGKDGTMIDLPHDIRQKEESVFNINRVIIKNS